MKAAFELKIAQKQLQMADDDYRANLAAITGGKTSSKQLTQTEIKAVLELFMQLGYQPVSNPREPQIKRITYLWLRLKEAGVLRSSTKSAMYQFCDRFTQGKSLYKASPKQLSGCIEALQQWCEREGVAFNKGGRQ